MKEVPLEVHGYYSRWIQAKEVLLTSEEYGEDMTTVNTLLNTHLDIVRELETLSEKVDKLEQDAETLSETHPERAKEVRVREVGV